MSRGEGLDKLEVLMSLGAILSNVPEVSRFMNQNRGGDKEKKGVWLIKLLETLTSKDDALLEQNASMLSEPNKSLIRDLVRQMGRLDRRNDSSYVTSLAARLYLMENPLEEHIETPAPITPSGQQKGGKVKSAAPTITKKISKANTPESSQVIYLNSLAADIQALMQGTPAMTREQAISRTIKDLELRGVISKDSLKKKLEEAKEQLKELNPKLLYIITESISVLGKDGYDCIAEQAKEASETAETDPELRKKFYEERLELQLELAMAYKTGLDLPEEERRDNRKTRSKQLAKIPDQYRILYGIMAAVAVVAFIAFAIWSNYHP
ncbi:MAG: hypothetical protein HGB37_02705 [Candidatus Moranbacteria bacterium]|nr:hypothetical protein [Candidatus Moranbacteria bacterium]